MGPAQAGGLRRPGSALLRPPCRGPFPLVSGCCLGNLLQLFPGIWICLFSKENKHNTHTEALGRAFLCKAVFWPLNCCLFLGMQML